MNTTITPAVVNVQAYYDKLEHHLSTAHGIIARLREAAEKAHFALDDRYDGAPDSKTRWMAESLDALAAALALTPATYADENSLLRDIIAKQKGALLSMTAVNMNDQLAKERAYSEAFAAIALEV